MTLLSQDIRTPRRKRKKGKADVKNTTQLCQSARALLSDPDRNKKPRCNNSAGWAEGVRRRRNDRFRVFLTD